MTKPSMAQDIMSRQVITCTSRDSLAEVRKRMKEHNIRHIPVVDELTGPFRGTSHAKEVLQQAFDIANKFGIGILNIKRPNAKSGISCGLMQNYHRRRLFVGGGRIFPRQ